MNLSLQLQYRGRHVEDNGAAIEPQLIAQMPTDSDFGLCISLPNNKGESIIVYAPLRI